MSSGPTYNFPKTSDAPGEQFEPRQTFQTEDFTPDPSKSIKLSKARQELMDDIIDLYNMKPTAAKIKRYTADCVYDDQFVYANDRYKMAAQWYALPKLFKSAKENGYEVIKSDDQMIQFKNSQDWTFKVIPKTATVNAIVTLVLSPDTINSDFIQVKYHKDQANEKEYSHNGVMFTVKKFQADNMPKAVSDEELKEFEPDRDAQKEAVRKYKSGKDAPQQVV